MPVPGRLMFPVVCLDICVVRDLHIPLRVLTVLTMK